MKTVGLLRLVVTLWAPTLGATEYKIVTYLYYIAASTPDRKISKSIQEIVEATNLAWRTVQAKLHDLEERGVIKILSYSKERMLVEIPQQHWSLPVSEAKPVAEQLASIPELIFRLTKQRPSPAALAEMKAAAANDDQRLQQCLNSFLQQNPGGWATVTLLTAAVAHALKHRDGYSYY